MEKFFDKLPYYFSIIQILGTVILIINHAMRDLLWQPLLLLLIPMLGMYYAEQRRIYRK
tara:strand:+ start:1281 stop:1457 length:177 start_codon:yes stop_codon:yes gene_type:complete